MLECLIGCGNLLLKRRSLPFFRVKLVAEFFKSSFARAFYFYVSNHLKLSTCEGDTRLVAPQDQSIIYRKFTNNAVDQEKVWG